MDSGKQIPDDSQAYCLKVDLHGAESCQKTAGTSRQVFWMMKMFQQVWIYSIAKFSSIGSRVG